MFDPVAGVVTDYLHCVLLGVTKLLLNYWFDRSNRRKKCYIGNKVTVDNYVYVAETEVTV